MTSHLQRYFISGLLVWLPIWVTLLVIKFVVNILDNMMALLPHRYQPDQLIGFHIPGVGVVITLLVIFFTGVVAANFLGKYLVVMWDAFIGRIPLVRSIHAGVKQILQTVFTPGGDAFRKVLLVRFPHSGLWSIAFQTGDVAKEIAKAFDEPMVNIFIPATPNPTSGFLMMVSRKDTIELSMSVEQALKHVISLGVVQPGVLPIKKYNGVTKSA